jgi:hypothetical protein
MNFMALFTHSFKSRNMERDRLARITNAEHRLIFIALGLIDNDERVYGKLIPLKRIIELIPVSGELRRIEAGNIVIVNRPVLSFGSLVDFLDCVKRFAMALEAGAEN